MPFIKTKLQIKFNEETYDEKGAKDETDFPSDKEMLKQIENAANPVAKRLLKQAKNYSKLHFQENRTQFNIIKQPYKSRLMFNMFDEPSNINPQTDTKYLVAIQRILVAADDVMSKIEDDAIQNILTHSENVLQILDKFVPRLVVQAEKYPWNPPETSYNQLESDADLMKKSDLSLIHI